VGVTGPHKGGKYLFFPPGYTGELPSEGYVVVRPSTYANLAFYRAFVEGGDIAAAANSAKAKARMYPLSAAAAPNSCLSRQGSTFTAKCPNRCKRSSTLHPVGRTTFSR
jgi:hypothetical protein